LPWRVNPGRLSVSRTFGDIFAKHESLGGKSGVITADPDLYEYEIDAELDFVILACDGVFDRLENEDIINDVWKLLRARSFYSVHEAAEIIINSVFENSIRKMSYDNISIIFLGFENFVNAVNIFVPEDSPVNISVIPEPVGIFNNAAPNPPKTNTFFGKSGSEKLPADTYPDKSIREKILATQKTNVRENLKDKLRQTKTLEDESTINTSGIENFWEERHSKTGIKPYLGKDGKNKENKVAGWPKEYSSKAKVFTPLELNKYKDGINGTTGIGSAQRMSSGGSKKMIIKKSIKSLGTPRKMLKKPIN
jgi:hypothetical protein